MLVGPDRLLPCHLAHRLVGVLVGMAVLMLGRLVIVSVHDGRIFLAVLMGMAVHGHDMVVRFEGVVVDVLMVAKLELETTNLLAQSVTLLTNECPQGPGYAKGHDEC